MSSCGYFRNGRPAPAAQVPHPLRKSRTRGRTPAPALVLPPRVRGILPRPTRKKRTRCRSFGPIRDSARRPPPLARGSRGGRVGVRKYRNVRGGSSTGADLPRWVRDFGTGCGASAVIRAAAPSQPHQVPQRAREFGALLPRDRSKPARPVTPGFGIQIWRTWHPGPP